MNKEDWHTWIACTLIGMVIMADGWYEGVYGWIITGCLLVFLGTENIKRIIRNKWGT